MRVFGVFECKVSLRIELFASVCECLPYRRRNIILRSLEFLYKRQAVSLLYM